MFALSERNTVRRRSDNASFCFGTSPDFEQAIRDRLRDIHSLADRLAGNPHRIADLGIMDMAKLLVVLDDVCVRLRQEADKLSGAFKGLRNRR